jgi:FkbM family methyltransferase
VDQLFGENDSMHSENLGTLPRVTPGLALEEEQRKPLEWSFGPIHSTVMSIIKALPLGRKFAWRAYNYFLWRMPGTFRGRTSFGAEINCAIHDQIQRMIFYFGVWEPEVTNIIRQRLRAGGTFLDIGSNIGYDTLLAASCVGPSGRVIAIEASHLIFEKLNANIRRNAFRNISLHNVAISDFEGKLSIFAGPDTNIGMTTTRADRGLEYVGEVDTLPIEKLLDAKTLKSIQLIKMDVEGAEAAILSHLVATLDLYSNTMELIVELAPPSSDEERRALNGLFETFRSNGFRAYAIENNYNVDFYLAWKQPSGLTEIKSYPEEQTDVLFTRSFVQRGGHDALN